MKTLPALFAALLLATPTIAEPSLGDAQAALKTQGFYFGEANGQESAETTAALRRFQIRNGLKVTGKLNDETLAALGLAEAKAPAPTPAPVQQNPPSPAAEAAPPKPVREPMPEEVQPPRPPAPADTAAVPRAIPTAEQDDFSTFYHGTPYSNAPREVQASNLRKAQSLLAKRGLYRGALDGTPGRIMSDALFDYQAQRKLRQTGRLDLSTLADLNLLPGHGPDAPPLKPFRDPRRSRDRSVERVR